MIEDEFIHVHVDKPGTVHVTVFEYMSLLVHVHVCVLWMVSSFDDL